MDKQYKELEDLINTIIVTAKLIGYRIVQENNITHVYNYQFIPLLEITLYKRENSPIVLKSLKESSYIDLTCKVQQEKINHLQKLLQEL